MSSTGNSSLNRSSLVHKNIAVSILAKIWSAVILLLLVPVTLNCLGEYTNGVWLTISSMLIWIEHLDIGLGNGLRNQLTACLAHDDFTKARQLISSTFALLACIMAITIVVLIILIISFDSYRFFNVDPQRVDSLDTVLVIVVILVCSTFVLKLIGNFYMALQLPAVSNMLIALGQTFVLGSTYLIFLSGSHSLIYIALANTVPPLVVYSITYPCTFLYKYPHLRLSLSMVNLKDAMGTIHLGVQFFIMQLSGIILFLSSNILISKFFSPSMVTPYQITYRYFSLLLVLFNVVCMPFWNATTDAYERGDIKWIQSESRKLTKLSLGFFLAMIVMVVISDKIYALWIGDELHIDKNMSIMMAIYIAVLIGSIRYSFFINGIGTLRLQLIMTSIAAVLFIPLAYVVTSLTHSILWFIGVMCIVNIPGLIVNRIQFMKLIHGKATGIWKK